MSVPAPNADEHVVIGRDKHGVPCAYVMRGCVEVDQQNVAAEFVVDVVDTDVLIMRLVEALRGRSPLGR